MPRAGSSGFSIAVLAVLSLAWPAFGQRVTTFAGGGVGEQSPALGALLLNPSHLAVDRFNNLHVTDRGGHRILKITPSGTISTVMGTGSPGRFDVPGGYRPVTAMTVNSPSGIVFRPTQFVFSEPTDAQDLLFADTGNHWIMYIETVTASEPTAYREMGTSFQGYCCDDFNVFADFDTPQGLAVDAHGNVFIADTNNHIVRRLNWHDYMTAPTIDRIAGVPQQAGSTGDGGDRLAAKLQHPRGVAVDAAGELYIAESHRIRKVDMATGIVSTLVGGTTAGFNGDGAASAALLLDTPTDLTFGPDGNLYFVDSGNYRVRRIVAGAVQTVAGTGAAADSGDGGLATGAGLAGPRGIAFDHDGHLFVTMYDSGRIRRIAAGTGVITTYAGGAGVQPNGGSFAGDGGLARGIAMNSPAGATPLADGGVYLADAFNHRVRLVSPGGIVSTVAGDGTPAALDTPVSVAVDASGNRYIAEAGAGRVRKLDPGGTLTTFAGGGVASPGNGGPATSALLLGPTWVVVRGSDVYISDGPGNRIVKVSAGILTTVVGTGSPGSTGDGGPATSATLDFPGSFVFDAAGNLYVTEAVGNRVRKVTTGGTISTVAGTGTPGFSGDGGPATAAQLDLPMGISVDDAGALYIVDGNNHRVRKVLPDGTIKTMAGNGTPGFSGDGGDAPSAMLNQPSFITRDTAGRLYVADTDNHRVRRIDPRIPFAPTLGALTPGAGSISVAFTPPADDGNAAIVEYGVECNGPTSAGQAGTGSPIVVGGLTSGGSYTCFAYARNSAGWGELSTTSSPVTVGVAPSITSAAPAGGAVGSAYTHNYTSTAVPAATYTVTSGALPGGLALSSAGAITGTPSTAGSFTGVVTATNGIPPDATQGFSITIAKATTTVSLGSSANPSLVGGSVTFTATLPSSTPAPTGTITFKDAAATIAGCSALPLSTGQAACTTSALSAGTHAITAEYSGDAAYYAATSTPLSQGVSLPSHLLTVTRTGAGTGTVTGNAGGLACGATCSVAYPQGTVVTLTATPATGSSFDGWGSPCSGTGSCIVTMDAAKSLAANFGIASYQVTPSASAGGSISPNTPQTVAHGATRTFMLTPNAGHVTASVTGCGGSYSPGSSTYTTGPITGDCTVSAAFVSLGSDLGTTLTANPMTPNVGQDVTFTLTLSSAGPEAGFEVGTWIVVPAGMTFVSASAGCNPLKLGQMDTVACFPGAVPIGATPSFTFVLRPSVTGGLTVTGHVSSSKPDPVAGNNESSVTITAAAANPARLANISTRMQVLTGDDVMIGGFIIGGSANKSVVVRARGPSLTQFGVPGVLANPQLQLFQGQALLAANDNWADAANAAAVQASGFAPSEPSEAAILMSLAPGAYTAIVSGVSAGTGVAIVEVFEVDAPEAPLVNIATRGRVQTGDNVMIAGLIIQGSGSQTVVVRARGPSLAQFGVPGVLANPQLQLFSGSTLIGSNDDWQQAANAAAIQGAGFAPDDARESAILVTLQPGAYSAIVSGVGGGTGVAIVEAFRVP